jgi:5'-methylthioadenosine phosphorylase
MVKIGIIGGSGLDDPHFLKEYKEISVSTPYGKPSSRVTTGTIGNSEVAILARHGKKHTIWPTGVNFRANIYALKKLKCTHILATTAVGSLREHIKPGDLVLPDQFIDFTKHRFLTFHDKKVIHTSMSDPFCGYLCELLSRQSKRYKFKCHKKATLVTIEGPRFSTRAESSIFRLWGADIINMSTVPEVILARELKMCYATIAMSTDYDSWKINEEPVTWDMIVKRMEENVSKVREVLFATIPKIQDITCLCRK